MSRKPYMVGLLLLIATTAAARQTIYFKKDHIYANRAQRPSKGNEMNCARTNVLKWGRGLALCMLLLVATVIQGWAQGIDIRTCDPNGSAYEAYFCLDDIIVVDGSGYNYDQTTRSGGVYLIKPDTGNQKPISTGGYLNQGAFLTLEPGTSKILVSSRTYGVIRIDPADGSQEVLLKGGTGWGTFQTFQDAAHGNVAESFIYPAGITIDGMDGSIMVVDAGINLLSTTVDPAGNPNCSNSSDVMTCEALPGKIIRIQRPYGAGVGVYDLSTGVSVMSKGGSLSRPFSIVADLNGSQYVTSMSAKLGGVDDPGKGGIVFVDALNAYAQSTFFSSYLNNPSATGCPMGLGTDHNTTIYFSVFSYNGFGCVTNPNQGVYTLTLDPWGVNPPTLATVITGTPMAYPFGMDADRNGRIVIADEASGYGCAGTIFRYDPSQPIMRVYDPGWTISNLNPYALSPKVGLGCSPPNQSWLGTPSNVIVVKVHGVNIYH